MERVPNRRWTGRGGTGQGRDRDEGEGRAKDKLWAGGEQSEIADPAREQAVSHIYVGEVLSPVNRQSNPFSSQRHVKPSNRVVREVNGFRAELVTE